MMTFFAFIGLGVLITAVALWFAIADSVSAPDWLEEEEYRRNHWYK